MAFPINSRYYGVETAEAEGPDGRKIVYLRRRFLPAPERFATIFEHTVAEGERLDQLAAAYFDDPELFWRICDANVAVDPDELTVINRRLRITMPEGIPGPANQV
jgi:hypothetical protein